MLITALADLAEYFVSSVILEHRKQFTGLIFSSPSLFTVEHLALQEILITEHVAYF